MQLKLLLHVDVASQSCYHGCSEVRSLVSFHTKPEESTPGLLFDPKANKSTQIQATDIFFWFWENKKIPKTALYEYLAIIPTQFSFDNWCNKQNNSSLEKAVSCCVTLDVDASVFLVLLHALPQFQVC